MNILSGKPESYGLWACLRWNSCEISLTSIVCCARAGLSSKRPIRDPQQIKRAMHKRRSSLRIILSFSDPPAFSSASSIGQQLLHSSSHQLDRSLTRRLLILSKYSRMSANALWKSIKIKPS